MPVDDGIVPMTLAKRHASVERALSLTRSEDSPVTTVVTPTAARWGVARESAAVAPSAGTAE